MTIPKALTIAGSDSSGGAGIQADLKTFSAFHVFGMSVLTALTAQNSLGVQAIHNVPAEFVAQQIDSVLSDLGTDSAKTGMLSTGPIIRAVAAKLREYKVGRLVVDPVMIAKSGDPLLAPDARSALLEEIFPLALVVTPNLPEASALAEMPVTDLPAMEEAARRIHRLGPQHVLVKGGHLKGDAVDLLFDGRGFSRFAAPRIESSNTHGTGCTLSAAIASGLAKERPLVEAVREAKAYVTRAIREGFAVGRGVGALRHFVRVD
jgi:hydroxymethylpyrimidine/phosphomethylpyrimidine kinase